MFGGKTKKGEKKESNLTKWPTGKISMGMLCVVKGDAVVEALEEEEGGGRRRNSRKFFFFSSSFFLCGLGDASSKRN